MMKSDPPKNVVRPLELSVPEPYREGIQMLASIGDVEMRELTAALHDEPPSIRRETFVSGLASRVKDIQPTDIDNIVVALVGLNRSLAALELSVGDFAEGISKSDDMDIPIEKRGRLSIRLRALLDSASLTIISKAIDVLTDNERGFHDTRVMTDVRPIFGQDPLARPLAAIILHRLKITYHTDNGLENFFVTLDELDLKMLRRALDRAEAKATTLEASVEEAHIPRLKLD